MEEMYERIKLEKAINDMHKRFKLGVSVKEIIHYDAEKKTFFRANNSQGIQPI